MKSEEFQQVADVLSPKQVGKQVHLRGWIYRKRDQKELIFLVLRDSSDIIQAVVKKDSKAWKDAEKITIESSCELSGKIKKEERAPTGYELEISDLKIIGLAERYPIARDLSEEFLRDVRHLWLRSRKLTSILRIRSEVIKAIHDFYSKKGFIEYQSPIFTTQACEGGSTLFEVKGFDKKMYLSQSWQLHAEAAIFALEKIYTIAPMFRAEKSRTTRHLAEAWLAEAEAAWLDFEGLMKQQEELIQYIVFHILKTCEKELKEFGRDLEELKKLKPFKKMTYQEALTILGKDWGYDLTDKDERELVSKVGGFVFLTHFPRDMKAFYMKPDPQHPETVLGVDLLAPGVGEISGGSERIADKEELMKSLEIFKLKPEDYGWYLDLRKYGSVPHSGFGMGIDRFLMWLTGTPHIMDVVPFPRTMERIYP